MKTSDILPGYTITLENGNSFKIMTYKGEQIIFPENSYSSVHSLNEFCNEDLSPRPGISKIMIIRNNVGVITWKRKFKCSDIKPGFVLTTDMGTKYLVVQDIVEGLKIVTLGQYTIGTSLNNIVNEDMSAKTQYHVIIVEVQDETGKVVYYKKQ